MSNAEVNTVGVPRAEDEPAEMIQGHLAGIAAAQASVRQEVAVHAARQRETALQATPVEAHRPAKRSRGDGSVAGTGTRKQQQQSTPHRQQQQQQAEQRQEQEHQLQKQTYEALQPVGERVRVCRAGLAVHRQEQQQRQTLHSPDQ